MLLAATAWLFTSCLKSEDDEIVYYSDTGIATFSLGTLNRYVTTKAKDGVTDSTYKVTVTGSSYLFRIDQINRKIYNTDSLPYGTDIKKVVMNITTKNAGTVYVKSLNSDSIVRYNGTDSLDFSKPREIRVYAYNGTTSLYRSYEVTVNVRKEPADTSFWTKMPEGAEVPVVEKVNGSSKSLYKVENGQILRSQDKGATWTVEQLDGDANLLPDANINFTCKTVKAANQTEYVLLTGTSKADSKNAVNWFRYEGGEGDANGRWTYIRVGDENKNPLPKLSNLNVARFSDDLLIAIGGAGLDDCKEAAYASTYVSHDNGITWISNDGFKLPEGLDTSATNITLVVDGDGFVWLACEGTGEVWRGRISQYSK